VALDRTTLARLVVEVDAFYLRDKKMKKAQAAMSETLAHAGEVDEAQARAYLRALDGYFSGFAREAKASLADVERRLAKVNQVQYNLTAERGVAAKRVELTQGVLERIAELGRR
jgi:hypothetical protein